MDKKILRKIYLDRRRTLSKDQINNTNQALLTQFMGFDLSNVAYLHTFLPILERVEVDTQRIISYIKSEHPHIKILVPKSDFSTRTLTHYLLDDTTRLEKNAYGITEPISGTEVSADKIDMILVPLLAFDRRGYRLGYGMGFYDQFLSACKPDVQKIGLSMFDVIEEIESIEPHDIRLDACITAKKVYRFGGR